MEALHGGSSRILFIFQLFFKISVEVMTRQAILKKIKHGAQHMFCFEAFKYSCSCISKCNHFYLIFWCGVISFLTISIHVSRFTCCQEWGILNPLISSLELSCVIFHLKPSLRNVAIMVLINDPSFLLSSRWKELSSPCWPQSNLLFSLVAEFRLNFEKFSISPLQAYLFRCWFSNDSVITFSEGCFPSSFVAEVGSFYSILSFE